MINTLKTAMNEQPALFAGTAAFLILATAFGFQFAGYPPCEMCWWQRYPYMAVIAATIIALTSGNHKKTWFLFLLAALFLTDAGIAGFHAGVEQKWWEGPTTCSQAVDLSGDISTALENIMNAPLVRCDEIPWSLFGISMAGYNFLLALALGLFCLVKGRTND
ncbi:dihydroneopterin aldolase [Kordiimonas sediminis]|uniref:Dihydroneopterin aldolase n=1 Tax=Kordiimonas sediminis TaxID=1735581 RepID=A0A919AK05_9PROT|nr:disulfide bond formation protein B [Kordiimonas sediminis]GHF11620.1 dihydroneopterin aldolase [Kordiimonas sediminis]